MKRLEYELEKRMCRIRREGTVSLPEESKEGQIRVQ